MWGCVYVFLLLHCEGPLVHDPVRIPAKILGGNGACPSDQDTIDATRELRQNVSAILSGTTTCGGTGWRRVGYLDMTDPSQSCPSGLTLKNYSPVIRSCGRAANTAGCWSTFYNTGGTQYSRVCGRVRGYQFGDGNAFYSSTVGTGLNSNYVDGVSLTHGQSNSRTHIWTFASALSETNNGIFHGDNYCRCITLAASQPPAFVGNDYFCESGLHTPWVPRQPRIFYPSDPLWDSLNCISSCCQLNSPPYFTKTLPAPTSDDIELRICSRFPAQADIPIDQVELYVQ